MTCLLAASPAALGQSAALSAVPAPAAAPAVDAGPERAVEPLSVDRQVIPEAVKLGEPFVYRITVHHPPGQRWELRTPRDLGGYELVEQSRTRSDGKTESTTTYLLKMALFELGSHVLPTLTFDVVDATGAGVARIDGPDIEGKSSLPKDADQLGAKLADIKPNEDVPVRSWRLLWWVVGALAAAALFWFGLRAGRNRPRRPVLAAPPLPLDERTLQALAALEADGLPERGLQREFHFRLNGVVRAYLGERFGFDALECTSGELLREVDRRALPGVEPDALREFVDQCDVARYARGEVPVPACASALAFARSVVESTRPRPAPPVAPAAPPPGPGSEVARP
ncbi:MAG TPA: hypothetical protein VFN91_17785 [Myxococcaceae bacterium]|nr:hypothetical protein [Myxococcaceae bacterium]